MTTAPVATAAHNARSAERTAREFEAVFAGQLAQLLLSQVEAGDFGGGHGEEMFKGVLAEELGKSIAAGKSLGIAPAVLMQIHRLQEKE